MSTEITRTPKTTALLALAFLTLASPLSAAGFNDGVAAIERGDYPAAVEIFRPLAEAGDVASAYNLALAYANGRGVERDDAVSVKWLTMAASADFASAELMLGIMRTYGRGVPVNLVVAAELFERAALHGNAAAQFSLGVAYQRGQGVPKDDARAVALFRKASLQGHSKSQVALAAALTDGVGVGVDLEQAYMWLTLAGESMTQGRPKELTLGLRDEVGMKMDATRIARAGMLAAAFVAKPDPDAIPEGHLGDPAKENTGGQGSLKAEGAPASAGTSTPPAPPISR